MRGTARKLARVHAANHWKFRHDRAGQPGRVGAGVQRQRDHHLARRVRAHDEVLQRQASAPRAHKGEHAVRALRLKRAFRNVDHSMRAALAHARLFAVKRELRLVAIAQRFRRRERLPCLRRVHAAQTRKRVHDLLALERKRARVGNMLRLTAAAHAIMRADRYHAVGRRLPHVQQTRRAEALLFGFNLHVHRLAGNREGYENGAAVRKTADALHFRPDAGNENRFSVHRT